MFFVLNNIIYYLYIFLFGVSFFYLLFYFSTFNSLNLFLNKTEIVYGNWKSDAKAAVAAFI